MVKHIFFKIDSLPYFYRIKRKISMYYVNTETDVVNNMLQVSDGWRHQH